MLSNQRGIAHIFVVFFLVIGIVIGLYLVQNPQIFSPRADEGYAPVPTTPNIPGAGGSRVPTVPTQLYSDECIIPTGNNTCDANLMWNYCTTPNHVGNVNVRIEFGNDRSVFTTSCNGFQTIPWITATGTTFYVYTDNVLADTIPIKGIPYVEYMRARGQAPQTNSNEGTAQSAPYTSYFTATPNPCVVNAQGQCTTTLSWFYCQDIYSDFKIYIQEKKAGENLFTATCSGKTEVNWIPETGYVFQIVKDGKVVSKYPVKGSKGTFFSANPNPCVIPNGAATCKTTLSWNYCRDTETDLKIYIKEKPTGSNLFTAYCSGSTEVNWIPTSGFTFQITESNQTINSVVVQGVNAQDLNDYVTFTASPNPCTLPASGLCTSIISWQYHPKAGATIWPNIKITLKENPGSILSTSFSATTSVPWITKSGATFQAYDGTRLLGELFVNGQ